MTRRARITLSILGVLLVLRLALPYGARAILEAQASEAIGRPVAVEDVSLSLSRGAASLSGIRVGSEEDPLLRVAQVSANLDVLDLVTGEIRLESVRIVEPGIALRLRSDGTVEPLVIDPGPGLDSSEDTPSGPRQEAEPEPEGEGWPLRISELGVEDLSVLLVPSHDVGGSPAALSLGRLSLRDFSIIDGQTDFGSIQVESPRVSVAREFAIAPAPEPPVAPAPAAERATQPSEGGASISGSDFTIADAQLAIQVGEHEQVDLALAASVRDVRTGPGERFPAKIRLERTGGWLEIEGDVGVQPVAFEGSVKLGGLSLEHVLYLADPETAPRVKKGVLGGELTVEAGIDPAGVRAAVDGELSVDDLSVDAEGRELSASAARLTLGGLVVSPGADGVPGFEADTARLELDGFGLRDGTIDPVAVLELLELRVDAGEVRWPERHLTLGIAFKGLGEMAGTATSRLEAGSGRSELEISAIPVGNFSGYVRPAGFLLNAGHASIVGEGSSRGTVHDASFDVALAELQIETIDAGAFEKLFGMSPDLALAVLQDPTGAVRLPLHVELDTADGGSALSLAQLVTGAVRQAFTGIVTMPLKGLGVVARGVIGESGQLQMEPISFESGSSDWLEGEQGYIDAIARTLEARPAIHAKLVGRALEDEARNPERLAEKRANAVSRALRDAGVAPESIQLVPPVVGESGVVIEFIPRPPVEDGD